MEYGTMTDIIQERPILFSGQMVRAILAGTKTQTRRVMKGSSQPYGCTGQRLWVRETLRRPDGDPWLYAADGMAVLVKTAADVSAMIRWADRKPRNYCPSIHMPRWASRITLEITDIRTESLQDISEEDARAEGISVLPLQDANDPSAWWQSAPGLHQDRTARGSFGQLWNSIHAKEHRWTDNPQVRVIAFRLIEP